MSRLSTQAVYLAISPQISHRLPTPSAFVGGAGKYFFAHFLKASVRRGATLCVNDVCNKNMFTLPRRAPRRLSHTLQAGDGQGGAPDVTTRTCLRWNNQNIYVLSTRAFTLLTSTRARKQQQIVSQSLWGAKGNIAIGPMPLCVSVMGPWRCIISSTRVVCMWLEVGE